MVKKYKFNFEIFKDDTMDLKELEERNGEDKKIELMVKKLLLMKLLSNRIYNERIISKEKIICNIDNKFIFNKMLEELVKENLIKKCDDNVCDYYSLNLEKEDEIKNILMEDLK
jgi:hypothetical protein